MEDRNNRSLVLLCEPWSWVELNGPQMVVEVAGSVSACFLDRAGDDLLTVGISLVSQTGRST